LEPLGAVGSSQEQWGAVGSSGEQSGAVRSSGEQWGAVGSSQEQWGAVGSSLEQWGAVGSSQEQSGAVGSSGEQSGAGFGQTCKQKPPCFCLTDSGPVVRQSTVFPASSCKPRKEFLLTLTGEDPRKEGVEVRRREEGLAPYIEKSYSPSGKDTLLTHAMKSAVAHQVRPAHASQAMTFQHGPVCPAHSWV
jgi:hypothetical protein